MKTRYSVLCETREIGSECVTAWKEEKVRQVSPFLLTQRLGSVVPRFASERRNKGRKAYQNELVSLLRICTELLQGGSVGLTYAQWLRSAVLNRLCHLDTMPQLWASLLGTWGWRVKNELKRSRVCAWLKGTSQHFPTPHRPHR